MSGGVKKHQIIWAGILFCALTFLVVGILLDEPTQVMDKAIRICLECIGVG